jgi:DNA-binding transcriptional LysR family regulator
VDHAVVSRHLRSLEAWLGQTLFDRSGSVPRLNAIGRTYHEVITRAIVDIAHGTREVAQLDKATRLLIWCAPGLASRWLAVNLEHFMHRNPGVEVEVRPADVSPNFTSDDVDGDIRFIRDTSNSVPPSGVNWMNFARPPVFPVGSPALLLTNRHETCQDLLKIKMLHEENDEEWRSWFLANGLPVNSRLSGARLWHAHVSLDGARRGQGIAMANPFLITEELANGSLQIIKPVDARAPAVEMGSYIFATRTASLGRPAVRKFRDWLALRAADFLAADQAWA